MIEISKVNVVPAYQMVSLELQRLIFEGAIEPGQALPSETDLAERFGVNRSTVREGIRQLESEGLVQRIGRKKLVITIPGQKDLSPRVERALLMQEVTFGELWEMAIVLEPMAAARAAERATETQIDALKDNVSRLEASVETGARSDDIDTEFHTMLAECTGNKALLISREPIGQLLFRPYVELSPHVPQAPARNLRAHKEILAAITARDSDQARHWMERHIRDLRTGWEMAGRAMSDPMSPA